MILLASTTDKLQVVTGQASQIDVRFDWVDYTSPSTVSPGRTNTASIATATTTDVVASPAASTIRNIKGGSIRNRHATASCDITVKHTDGTNAEEIIKITLLVNETLIYAEGAGWFCLTASGGIEYALGGPVQSPLGFASAALAASPTSGQMEYDGVIPYFTPITSERGVLDAVQFIRSTATRTLTSQTAAQKIFGTPTNGQITVGANRSYHFECMFDLTTMSATSGSFGFALAGTATLTRQKWLAEAVKATLATAAAWTNTWNTAANTTIATASTATVGAAQIRGILTVGAGGTIIPQVSLGVAAAAVVSTDAFFRIWPVGSDTVQSVGNWS